MSSLRFHIALVCIALLTFAAPRAVDAQAQSSLHSIESLSLGAQHTCALMRTSAVRCWGSNEDGRLGDGTTTMRARPTAVSGLGRVEAVAAGGRHTCALLSNGSVRCWGLNEHGQLGDGTTTTRRRPVAVRGIRGITAIVAGGTQTCMLREEDGAVLCTGGAVGATLTALPVPGLTHASSLTAGWSHTCAVMSGHAYCWGRNHHGQLGDGSRETRMQPTLVPGLQDVTSLVASSDSTCALLRDGSVWCWGANDNGQLGQPAESDVLTPRAVDGASNATRLTMGTESTCAFRRDGTVQCWGRRPNGEFGDGRTSDDSVAPTLVPALTNTEALALGGNHGCAVFDSSQVRCWGDNAFGQLGTGANGGIQTAPSPVHGVLYRGVPPM